MFDFIQSKLFPDKNNGSKDSNAGQAPPLDHLMVKSSITKEESIESTGMEYSSNYLDSRNETSIVAYPPQDPRASQNTSQYTSQDSGNVPQPSSQKSQSLQDRATLEGEAPSKTEKLASFSLPSGTNPNISRFKSSLPSLSERKKVRTKEPFPKWGLIHSRMEKSYPRKISVEELKQHGSDAARQFTSIHGKVYDITEFRDFHPGGDEILKQFSDGKECGAMFDKYHAYINYQSLLANRFIGHLRKSE